MADHNHRNAHEVAGFVWAIARQVTVSTDGLHKTNDRSQRRRQRATQHATSGQGWGRGRGQENPREHYLPDHSDPTQVPRPRQLRDASTVMRFRPAHQSVINRRFNDRASCPARKSLEQALARKLPIHSPASGKGGHESGANQTRGTEGTHTRFAALSTLSRIAEEGGPSSQRRWVRARL
jgi:hypothetical protein